MRGINVLFLCSAEILAAQHHGGMARMNRWGKGKFKAFIGPAAPRERFI